MAEIARWHKDRAQDAEQLQHGILIQKQLKRYLAGSAQAPATAELLAWMRDLKQRGYGEVSLFDQHGALRLSTDARPRSVQDAAQLQAALKASQVTESDLQMDPGHARVHLCLWVPVAAEAPGLAQGALLLRVDAEAFLFPMIRAWPTPSPSAETLLVRRDGDQVVYLNGQRPGQGRPLASSLAIATHPDTPAVLAVTGTRGFVSGYGDPGRRVVGVIRRVPGTAWWMVAQVDEAEIFQPLLVRTGLTMLALVGLLLVLALAMGLLLRHRDNQQILGQLHLEQERKTLAERFQQIMHQANDIILLMNADGRILEANDRAREVYGYPLAQLEQMHIRDLRAPDSLAELSSNLHQAAESTLTRLETFHRRQDGSLFPVEVSARAVAFGGETFLLSFVRDITERHRQAQAIQRLTRLYSALSQVNQAIVWSSSPEQLFPKICQVLVEFGRFQMVWIGHHDPVTHTLWPLCHAGVAQDYFQHLLVRSDDCPNGRGPAGTAIRENQPCLFNRFLEAPETTPWHASAIQAGFAAAAAFPVRVEGEPSYVLSVYALERDFFGPEEMALLEEAALDVSFALGHLAQEALRNSAEQALQQSEARLKTITECAPDSILTLDALGQILYLNRLPRGTSMGQMLGRNWLEAIAPDYRDLAQAARTEALAKGETQEFEAPGVGDSEAAETPQGPERPAATGSPVGPVPETGKHRQPGRRRSP